MSLSNRQYKDVIYDQLARIGKSLSSGPRLEILDVLSQGPRTVEVLAGLVGQSLANTSHHLQVLRRARLVEAQKDGVHVTYSLASEEVGDFFVALRRLAQSRLLEVDAVTREFLEARGGMERIDQDAIVARVQAGDVTLIDVRPPEEWAAGHLPNALSVPLAELERRMGGLPRDKEIVAYCRGPYCVMALEAVDTLRAAGFTALRLEEGVADWRARGLEIARGDRA